ncbi:MAG: 16S rRNA (guanine(966)-N(2))-methyltransferase RsmD [Paracoccaceae bacterium]
MRIVAGRFGGRRLAALGKGDPAAHLRPTSDRVRESLFSQLTHLDVLDGARVLDMFSGTGALALEALSRGAEHAVLVENGRKAQGLIAENTRLTGTAQETTVLRRDATRIGVNPGDPCTLIFLDPPYGKGLGERAVAAAQAGGWIAPGACVVWEESQPIAPPPGFTLLDTRKHGDTYITLLRQDQNDETGDL